MTIRHLTVDSCFEILIEFTAHFAGTLKDWWISIGDNNKTILLTRQEFSEAIEALIWCFLEIQKKTKS